MNREKYFIDLSKLSEEQQKHIFSLLQTDKITAQIYYMIRNSDWGVLKAFSHLFFNEYSVWQLCSNRSTKTYGKNELTYPEFIKLFEGGEGDNIDYKSEFEKLKSLVMSDSVFWCLRRGIKYPSDFDFDDEGYIELNKWIKANSNQ